MRQPSCKCSTMKLHIYRGLDDEEIPWDVTHVIIDNSVAVIEEEAFYGRAYLVSVIMHDNVKRIEGYAFWDCIALRIIRLSKILEYIGEEAFDGCESLEALFLPSTLKEIEKWAFDLCQSLRLLILPIYIEIFDGAVFRDTGIQRIAEHAGVEYEMMEGGDIDEYTDESHRRLKEWLIHHMDASPFHKLCYNSSITTKQLNDYLTDTDHGDDSALTIDIDAIHGMTPLHMLSMNPHAPADAAAVFLNVNMEVAFCMDNQGKTPIDYARDYNVGGLIVMIGSLCNHRHSSV